MKNKNISLHQKSNSGVNIEESATYGLISDNFFHSPDRKILKLSITDSARIRHNVL